MHLVRGSGLPNPASQFSFVMPGCRTHNLSADGIVTCYELAPLRTTACFAVEIDFVLLKEAGE